MPNENNIMSRLKRTLRELEAAEQRYEEAVEAAMLPGTVVRYVHQTSHSTIEGEVECVRKNGRGTRVTIRRIPPGRESYARYTVDPACIIVPRTELLTAPQHPNTAMALRKVEK